MAAEEIGLPSPRVLPSLRGMEGRQQDRMSSENAVQKSGRAHARVAAAAASGAVAAAEQAFHRVAGESRRGGWVFGGQGRVATFRW